VRGDYTIGSQIPDPRFRGTESGIRVPAPELWYKTPMRSWNVTNPWSGLRGLPVEIWVLCAVTLVNRAGTMVLPFLALYITRDLGHSATVAGFAFVVYGVGAMLAAPVSGRLTDRVGPRRMMQLSLLTSGLVVLTIPLARDLVSLYAIVFAWAVTAESLRPASMTVVGELVPPEQRKPAFTLVRLAINLGMSLGPALGGFLAMSSFRLLFFVDGGTTLVAFLVLAFAPWRTRSVEPDRATETNGGTLVPRVSGAAHTDGRLLLFLFAGVIVSCVFFQQQAAMPLYLVEGLKFTEATYGLLCAINTGIIILCEIPISSLTSHWPHRVGLVLGSALFAVGFGALAFVDDIWSVAGTIVVWTFGEMLLMPAMSSYVTDISPPDRRGEYMGLYTMAFSLSFTIAPGLGTEVLERFGASAVWMGCLVTGLVSAAIFSRCK
jgi:MFS family permease